MVGDSPEEGYGFASNYIELVLVFLLTIPISVCAFFMLKRSSRSRAWYAVGWVLFVLSTGVFESNRENIDLFLIGSLFNLLIGAVVVGYLFFGRQAKCYFQGGSG